MENLRKGLLYAVTTAALWGFLAIALKVASAKVDSVTIVWFRFLVAFLSLLIYHLFRSPSELKILIRPPWMLVLAALGLSWNYMGFMLGIQYNGPGNTQVVIQTGPITLALVGDYLFSGKGQFSSSTRFYTDNSGTGYLLSQPDQTNDWC